MQYIVWGKYIYTYTYLSILNILSTRIRVLLRDIIYGLNVSDFESTDARLPAQCPRLLSNCQGGK